MPLPLLVVLMSAGAAGPVGLIGDPDAAPGTSEPANAVECVLPTADSADPVDTTQPSETTESADTTEPDEQTASLAYFDAFCARAQAVARVGPFLAEAPTLDGSEQFRAGMCDPEFVPPDEHQTRTNWTFFIRGTSQNDIATAEAWLDAGVLAAFDEDDDGATEIDGDVLDALVDIDMTFIETFAANQGEWCADLLEPVDTTEA